MDQVCGDCGYAPKDDPEWEVITTAKFESTGITDAWVCPKCMKWQPYKYIYYAKRIEFGIKPTKENEMSTSGQDREVAKNPKESNMVAQIDQAIARIIERTEGCAIDAQSVLSALSGYSVPCDAPNLKEDAPGLFQRFYLGTGRIEANLNHLNEILSKLKEETAG